MNTPIKDFTDSYAHGNFIRGHMPGHKGIFIDSTDYYNRYDITEINGADSLFEASGIIKESEKNAAEIFGSHQTLYSAGGSTLCIQTMLALCLMGKQNRKIVAVRTCHRAFIHACAFLDAQVTWVYPQYDNTMVSGSVTPQMIERAIKESAADGSFPACVYLTSPDYLGHITRLDEISEICHRHGAYLLVDNAHGAYLRFIYDNKIPLHPNFHGADFCCDSAHKTLPVLTGGAYLHINTNITANPKQIMSMFGSSSPSYLILRSLDMCNKFLSEKGAEYFSQMSICADKIKKKLSDNFWQVLPSEMGKLTISTAPAGYFGYELAEILRQNKIECEYADNSHIVIMLTGLTDDEMNRICQTFLKIPQRKIFIPSLSQTDFPKLQKAMEIREAVFSECEETDADKAEGRICGQSVSCCPPGIAAVVSGEIFTAQSINILKNYSIFKVNVVK